MKSTFVALWAVSLAAAQTFTDCNPSDETCPADTGLGGSKTWDMSSAPEGWKNQGGEPNYGPNGADFVMAKPGDAPTIISNVYIMYGNVEMQVRSASGKGVVSSAHLQSDCLDEIDWEWLGSDPGQVQTNYYRMGKPDHTKATFVNFGGHQDAFHTYTIDWTAERITWSIDGNNVRTLTSQAAGADYPQTPMALHVGPWAGGDPDQSPPGTVEWAGGPMDWSQAPYTMSVKSIKMTDYSTGDKYSYSDNSCTAGSIKADGGEVDGEGSPDDVPEVTDTPSSSEPPSSTGSDDSSTDSPESSTGTSSPEPTKTGGSDDGDDGDDSDGGSDGGSGGGSGGSGSGPSNTMATSTTGSGSGGSATGTSDLPVQSTGAADALRVASGYGVLAACGVAAQMAF